MVALSLPTLLLISVGQGATQTAPVNLSHSFAKGERFFYQVRSSLTAETRGPIITTAFPDDLDINYDFTMDVESMKADGVGVVHYRRPTVNVVEGETFDHPPKTTVDKVGYDLVLNLSTINEILDVKDLTKKKPASTGGSSNVTAPRVGFSRRKQQGDIGADIIQFIGEMERLALFTGSFDSALDLSPKLPLQPVKVGDTWKKTVGYQPQKLKAKNGKSAVQRLDYTYTYKGVVTVEGKKYDQVIADLDLNTDLAEFINDNYQLTSEDTGLTKLPLALKATIIFNLDPASHRTVEATATSQGGFSIFVKDEEEALIVSKLKGRTTMELANHVTGVK